MNKSGVIKNTIPMRFLIASVVVLFSSIHLLAQTETDSTRKLNVSGYLEAYYQYDFNQPVNNARPGFVYSHNRHNEFTVNLGFLRGSYTNSRVRANLAIAVGTYMNANYAAEPGVLRNIYEANAGVKLSKTKELWLDAGVFGSHIGYESAVGKDNWTLTRSLTADNTPYYLSGAKLTYATPNGKWVLTALAVNGWQQIQRADQNSRIGIGTQVQFKPVASLTLNSSTFIGAAPDSTNRNRLFHNLYVIWQVSDRLGLTAGFDYGIQQSQSGSDTYDNWQSASVLLRYQLADKWWVTGRFENYLDRDGIVIATGTPNGFNTSNYSLNLDFAPVENVLWRLEGRLFTSEDAVFADRNQTAVRTNAVVTTALTFSF
jgi:hypothetical protein